MSTAEKPRVPFNDLAPVAARVQGAALAAFGAVLDERAFIGGARVTALEAALMHALGAAHVVACANGTDALIVGLQALGVRAGMRVALPNLTFWASYEAVVQIGATPVLLDIDPHTLQLSFDALESAQRAHPLDACVLVHLFGWSSARLWDIRGFCASHGVRLVEDGAQAFGVQVDGVPVVGSAELATLSFFPGKVIGGCVDGGAVCARDEAVASRVRSLCNHGRTAHYAHDRVGWNSRMGGLGASYLLEVLALADEILDTRRRAAALYRAQLRGVPGITAYGPPPGQLENGYLNVLTVDDTAALARVTDAFTRARIGFARTYPLPIDAQPGAASAERHGPLDHSRAFCARAFNLPLYFGISSDDQTLCSATLRSALEERS